MTQTLYRPQDIARHRLLSRCVVLSSVAMIVAGNSLRLWDFPYMPYRAALISAASVAMFATLGWAVWRYGAEQGSARRLIVLSLLMFAGALALQFAPVNAVVQSVTGMGASPQKVVLLGSLAESALAIVVYVCVSLVMHAARETAAVHAAKASLAEKAVELELQARRLEEVERAAERANRAKREFLANISHEIRTPVSAIMGFSELLIAEHWHPQVDQEHMHAARTIHRNGKYLLSLIDDILDVSKIEAGMLHVERIECAPDRIVSEVQTLMQVRADAVKIPLRVRQDGPLPAVIHTDPTRLRQILINFVSNALKFTHSGEVEISVSSENAGGFEPRLRFDVRDTGIGMSAEEMARLFQPFTQADSSTTRKYGGTGLGLSISQRLAEMLGGRIEVASEVGRGSVFSFLLPLCPSTNGTSNPERTPESSPARTTVLTSESPQSLAGRKVLVVEDGEDNRRLIAHVLRKAGAEIALATNGQQAVDLLLGTSDVPAAVACDVVLMDMQMPVLDGYTATRQLRGAGYRGPIIALTANAMHGDRDTCLAAGCDEYLTKPIDRPALIALVAHFAARQPAEATIV